MCGGKFLIVFKGKNRLFVGKRDFDGCYSFIGYFRCKKIVGKLR